ncbi:hypothetical protein [Butyrivibrio sp. VCB2001]|uniref:hypothetical protein n=1 Tax=Butyrivibrio sp. VCB2001 TaxID=1280667 RepID=UPI0004241CBD|nr:hypothetical protein [Butyrivibrio sp. VCB2001]
MENIFSIIIAMIVSFVSVTGGMVNLPKAADTKEAAVTESVKAVDETVPEQVEYGRILAVGDSRTVDIFTGDQSEILGAVYDGITVYCRDAVGFGFLEEAVGSCGINNFDTLLTLMGCNSYGDFSKYGPYYDSLLAQGKKIVVCTVGPTEDRYLSNEFDMTHYENVRQIQYNNSLVAWAKERGVKIIDLYSYISNSSTVIVSEADGIHYFPQPTTELWNYIKANLK